MTEIRLEDILDKKHALYQLANRLNWEHLIRELESVVEKFCENHYWQYFCGLDISA